MIGILRFTGYLIAMNPDPRDVIILKSQNPYHPGSDNVASQSAAILSWQLLKLRLQRLKRRQMPVMVHINHRAILPNYHTWVGTDDRF